MDWKKRFKDYWFEMLVVVATAVYAGLIWWSTKELPYHWDGAVLVVNGAKWLLSQGETSGSLVEFGRVEMPIVQALVVGLWKIWGETVVVTRALFGVGLGGVMVASYLWAKNVAGRMIGVVVMFLVGMAPMTVAAVGLMDVGLVSTGLLVMAMWLWWENRRVGAMVLMAVAMLMSLPLGGFLLAFGWWGYKRERGKEWVKLVAIPVAVVLLWWVNLGMNGWGGEGLMNGEIGGLNGFWNQTVAVAQVYWLWHMRWIVVLIVGIMVGFLWMSKEIKVLEDEKIQGLVMGMVGYGIWIVIRGGVNELEGLPVLVMGLVVGAQVVRLGLEKIMGGEWKGYFLAGGLLVALVWLTQWHPNNKSPVGWVYVHPADLVYQDLIILGRELGGYLESVYEDTKVYGDFPETYQLTQPYQGYVSRALNFGLCSEFDETLEMAVVVAHPYQGSGTMCRRLAIERGMRMVQQFEQNGQGIEVYEYRR